MMTTLWLDDDDGEPLRIVTASVPVLARSDALEFSLSKNPINSYPQNGSVVEILTLQLSQRSI